MTTEERNQLKIKLINIIIDSSKINQKDLLAIYALYLTSTPDTLYNISYYVDRIDDFFKRIDDLSKKINLFKRIIKRINSKLVSHPQKEKFRFIFDDLFVYSLSPMKLKNENIDLFRLDTITPDKLLINISMDEVEKDFVFEYTYAKHKNINIITENIIKNILKHFPQQKEL